MTVIFAATGHRPTRLHATNPYSADNAARLEVFAHGWLVTCRPDVCMTGMALGWDTAWAVAARKLGIAVHAVPAFHGMESRWPAASQAKYHAILAAADEVTFVNGGHTPVGSLFARDEWMVLSATMMVALWDGQQTGGTWHTVKFAQRQGVPVENLWSEYARSQH